MRTQEERIMLMHSRAKEIRIEHDRAVRRVLGVVSIMLFVCLVGLTTVLSGVGHGIADTYAAGASMLADSVGGYVLVAVIAFVLGVLVTVIIKDYVWKKADKSNAGEVLGEKKEEEQNVVQYHTDK
ncbi:MAG: hypothetical protein IKO61_00600 [Lachnospiraceae bacterium]|nr:hypothetical protein [Lachnospiraceae bacterium]